MDPKNWKSDIYLTTKGMYEIWILRTIFWIEIFGVGLIGRLKITLQLSSAFTFKCHCFRKTRMPCIYICAYVYIYIYISEELTRIFICDNAIDHWFNSLKGAIGMIGYALWVQNQGATTVLEQVWVFQDLWVTANNCQWKAISMKKLCRHTLLGNIICILYCFSKGATDSTCLSSSTLPTCSPTAWCSSCTRTAPTGSSSTIQAFSHLSVANSTCCACYKIPAMFWRVFTVWEWSSFSNTYLRAPKNGKSAQVSGSVRNQVLWSFCVVYKRMTKSAFRPATRWCSRGSGTRWQTVRGAPSSGCTSGSKSTGTTFQTHSPEKVWTYLLLLFIPAHWESYNVAEDDYISPTFFLPLDIYQDMLTI